jgi:prolyl oligopeptidase
MQRVFYHRLGDTQSNDRLIYQDPAHPLRYFSGDESRDGRWLFIYSSEGTSGSEIRYRATSQQEFRMLLPGFDYDYAAVTCRDDKLYVLTNEGAPNYRLAYIDLLHPAGLQTVIAEHPDYLLESVTTGGGYLWATYLQDAQNRVYCYDCNGRQVSEVPMPEIGAVDSFACEDDDTAIYFTLNTYTSPVSVYRYDIATRQTSPYYTPEVPFDSEAYTTEQLFFTSTDGQRVPMFVSYRKGMKLNGKNPCYLYGYGGFQISLTPAFRPEYLLFMEQGGVVVNVNLRGGLEYGEKWHQAGMLDNKQQVFDDFIAAAEYLIAEGYTSSEKLAIAGGSNGGLLVGACEVQRPDLYAVCLPAVGVMDMLRYHLFTIGWGWATEYGTSADEHQFKTLYAYSPLHNIRKGEHYPATLVTTGDHDDRVVPAHSFKFAATLQQAQAGDAPILIRIEQNAGHGAGKPLAKRIAESADCYAFLFYHTHTSYHPIE